MKLLLAMNVPYVPALGGANKGNRLLAQALAERGHQVRVVVPALDPRGQLSREQWLAELDARHLRYRDLGAVYTFEQQGVEVHAVLDAAVLRQQLLGQARQWQPDWLLVSSEDPSHNLLASALESCPQRVIYLARTPQFLPFGPQAFFPSPRRAALFRQLPAIVTHSRFVQDYLWRWAGLRSTYVEISLYGAGPFPRHGDFDRGAITLVNASAVKGLAIFLALAQRFPDQAFAAVPGWGTTGDDLAQLRSRPNVELLEPDEDIDRILARTRVLVAPSLICEAKARIVIEAMLRGIPTLASDAGGMPEAKLGTDFVLPVRAVERFTDQLDERLLPRPVIPPQDPEPWQQALARLLGDRQLYTRVAEAGRRAALDFVASLSLEPLEALLARPPAAGPVRGEDPPAERGENPALAALEGLGPEQQALLLRWLADKSAETAEPTGPEGDTPAPQPGDDGGGDAPPSYAQQRLWFLDRLEPGSPAYNMPIATRVTGPLEPAVLAAACGEIVRRHQVLRTTLPAPAGEPIQRIAAPRRPPLPLTDLRALAPERRQRLAEALAASEAQRPFDLARGPLLRLRLLRLAPAEHLLLATLHHVVCDGWSLQLLQRELLVLYRAGATGVPSPLPELPWQYADFARWQRRWLAGGAQLRQLEYWRQQLGSSPSAPLQLPADRPYGSLRSSRGGAWGLRWPAELARSLHALGQHRRATLFMTLLAALKALLGRYSGQPEVAVGTPVAGRNREHTEQLIGFFVNTLVLRTSLAGDPSFEQLLARVRDTAVGAFSHQDLPFEKLVEELQPERDTGRSPLFQVFFDCASGVHRQPQPELPGLTSETLALPASSTKFDLSLSCEDTGRGIAASLGYSTDLFDATTVQRLARHLTTLLQAAAEHPEQPLSRLPLLDAAERHQTLRELNDTPELARLDVPVHRAIAGQARRRPEAVALVAGHRHLSYRQLQRCTRRLARRLRALGVAPEVTVGVALERSPELVVALLGVLEAGGTYLPLDLELPPQALAALLADAGSRLVIGGAELPARPGADSAGDLLRLHPDGRPAAPIRDAGPAAGPAAGHQHAARGNPAYLLYTSGSTGKPKGILISHGSLSHYLGWRQQALPIRPADRVLQRTPLSFDPSVWEVFQPLLAGATLVLATPRAHSDAVYLARCIAERSITTLELVPALLAAVLEHLPPGAAPALRHLGTGGEVLPPQVAESLLERVSASLHNGYGPAETCVEVLVWHCRRRDPRPQVPIGRPIAGARAYNLDARGQLLPRGVAGELHAGGPTLARGYLRRPRLSACRFVPDPFGSGPGERLYRTGDLVRQLADGNFDFLGRIDHQVKVHGVRIEPEGIETLLGQHPRLAAATVLARRDEAGDRLVAYVVASAPPAPAAAELYRFLAQRLPRYLLPAAFVVLPALPRLPGGKVDRVALGRRQQPLEASQLPRGGLPVPPRDAIELQLVQIWESLLEVRPVGVRDSFFELGGHSLLGVRLMTQIKQRFGRELPLAALFRAGTIEELAQLLRSGTAQPWSPLVAIQAAGTRQPFFCVHPIGGNVLCFYQLARRLGPEQPFYGLQAPGLADDADACPSIEEIAMRYLDALRSAQPRGPYLLGGFSFGCLVALEMAHQLARQGEQVALLALFDGAAPAPVKGGEPVRVEDAILAANLLQEHARQQGQELSLPYDTLQQLSREQALSYLLDRGKESGVLPAELELEWVRRFIHGFRSRSEAADRYHPEPFRGPITFFRTTEVDPEIARSLEHPAGGRTDPTKGWSQLAAGPLELHTFTCHHETMLAEPHVERVAARLEQCLERAMQQPWRP